MGGARRSEKDRENEIERKRRKERERNNIKKKRNSQIEKRRELHSCTPLAQWKAFEPHSCIQTSERERREGGLV